MEKKKYYIHVHDLYFNLLLMLKEDGINPRIITYHEICDFGKKLEVYGKTKDIDIVVVSTTRDMLSSFYSYHYSLLEEKVSPLDGRKGFSLKREISIKELQENGLVHLPFELFMIFMDKDFIKSIVDEFRHNHGLEKTEWTRLFIHV